VSALWKKPVSKLFLLPRLSSCGNKLERRGRVMKDGKIRLLYKNEKEAPHFITEKGDIQVGRCGCLETGLWRKERNKPISFKGFDSKSCPICGYSPWFLT
jgi:hypothetical protein